MYYLYNLNFQIVAQKGKPIPCIEHFEIAFKCAKCPNKDCFEYFLLADPFFVCWIKYQYMYHEVKKVGVLFDK